MASDDPVRAGPPVLECAGQTGDAVEWASPPNGGLSTIEVASEVLAGLALAQHDAGTADLIPA